jgi:ferric iron reductase protein FhuF
MTTPPPELTIGSATSTAPPAAALRAGLSALRARHGDDVDAGVFRERLVPPEGEWRPATCFVAGGGLDDLLDATARRWAAPPHVAASLAWKAYSYWLALPVIFTWTAGLPVPDPAPDRVVVRLLRRSPFVRIAFVPVASPSARSSDGELATLDRRAIASEVHARLLDQHLSPMLDGLRRTTRIQARVLRGELALSAARLHALSSSVTAARSLSMVELLTALGLSGGVRLSVDADGTVAASRRTCCLAFAAPGLNGRICRDCVVPPERRAGRARSTQPDQRQQRGSRAACRPTQ